MYSWCHYFEYNRNHHDEQDIISLKPWPVSADMDHKVVSSVVYCNAQSRGAKVTQRGKFSPFNCSPSRVGIITRQASLRSRSISGVAVSSKLLMISTVRARTSYSANRHPMQVLTPPAKVSLMSGSDRQNKTYS